MKTTRLIRIGGVLFLLLFLFNFVPFDAAARTAYTEEAGLTGYENRGAISGNDHTIDFNIVQELSSLFNNEKGSILKIEYFFDTDPGYGKGIALDFTTGSEITIDEAIPVHALDEGIHIFYMRVCDEAGRWSQTLNRIFLKTSLQTDNSYNITRAEYFFDTDPGTGNGFSADFTLSNKIALDNNWAVNALSDGVHMLYVRAMDEFGQWSQTFHRLFLKTHLQSDVMNIEEIEYFFDTDPGNGNGTKMENPGGEQLTVEQIIPVEDLSDGLHSINIRCRFSNNNWGQLFHRSFIKYPAYDVVKVEYYFDNDPGRGNAIDIPVTASEMVIIDDVFSISSLTSGNHTISIRALSEKDKWSEVFTATLTVFGGVGIDEAGKDRAFVKVYPNPTNGFLIVEINNINQEFEVQLISTNGSVLLDRKITVNGNTTLDLSSFSNGIYILKFLNKKEVRTQNIILSQ
ncbi:T9SS type A sorting domain-containing protein [Maribellus sediminis]|uniref:T9SS type A sorting domain-containing protein n=1 Tax=Maribellus sediminis TaxID=2696285 RepID=UPI00142F81B8|nr:T9SS type A sorting domain-containing protein [Maribellus sediminis]